MKKFTPTEISSQTQLKSSVHRGIRQQIISQFPTLETSIEQFLPKKQTLSAVKFMRHYTLIFGDSKEILFFQYRDGPWIPSLRLVHKYPGMLPKMQVDRGAIKFILKGSNIMCPGLTSAGGFMEDVEKDVVVQITGESKEHACAVGITTMSTAEIREKQKDVCIENMHYLNDGLWNNSVLD